jgi:hypothetical protein
MALRDQISDQGWADLLQAPAFLEHAVAGVARHGPIGSANENTALVMSLQDLARGSDGSPTGLLGEIADDLRLLMSDATSAEDRHAALNPEKSRYEDVPARELASGAVARVMSALTGLAPEDTLGYREWLVRVASDIAVSAKEGGGIFRHGSAISLEEQALLDEIGAALGVTGQP